MTPEEYAEGLRLGREYQLADEEFSVKVGYPAAPTPEEERRIRGRRDAAELAFVAWLADQGEIELPPEPSGGGPLVWRLMHFSPWYDRPGHDTRAEWLRWSEANDGRRREGRPDLYGPSDGGPTVLANGCFDRLHAGHLHLLREAGLRAGPGGRLIVAVNDDASVRRLKGEGRPFWPLARRMAAVRSATRTHAVVPFGTEEELAGLIESLGVSVVVKGDDYAGRPVISAGRPVVLVSRLPGYSTTAIIGGLNA